MMYFLEVSFIHKYLGTALALNPTMFLGHLLKLSYSSVTNGGRGGPPRAAPFWGRQIELFRGANYFLGRTF